MQNTNQEKQSYQINQDFILGKKLEGGIKLSTVTDFKPAGDQPEAIKKLISGVKNKNLKIMNKSEVKNFMDTYQRITQQMFKDMPKYSSIVMNLNNSHQIKNIKYR